MVSQPPAGQQGTVLTFVAYSIDAAAAGAGAGGTAEAVDGRCARAATDRSDARRLSRVPRRPVVDGQGEHLIEIAVVEGAVPPDRQVACGTSRRQRRPG